MAESTPPPPTESTTSEVPLSSLSLNNYKERALSTGLTFIAALMLLGMFFRTMYFVREGLWAHFFSALFFGISAVLMFMALLGLRKGSKEQASWAFFLVPLVSMLLIRAQQFMVMRLDLPVTVFGPLILLGLLAAVIVPRRAALGWCIIYTLAYIFVIGAPLLLNPSIPGKTSSKVITVLIPALMMIAIFRVAMWSGANATKALVVSEQQRVELLAANQALLSSNAALEEARHEAQSSSRSKSQFLANMSHELRTPLNAIIGYSELISEELEERGDQELSKDISRVLFQSQHLLHMIQDLLDLTIIESGELSLHIEPIDVKRFVKELVVEVEALCARQDNTLEVEVDWEPETFHGDPVRLKQCLMHLFDNATKFTKKGTIRFCLHERKGAGLDSIVFVVEDTGIGMTSQELAQIYQPFWQADDSSTRRIGGAGLGLSLTHDLCKRMGGTLEVESQPQQGTRFAISLPT